GLAGLESVEPLHDLGLDVLEVALSELPVHRNVDRSDVRILAPFDGHLPLLCDHPEYQRAQRFAERLPADHLARGAAAGAPARAIGTRSRKTQPGADRLEHLRGPAVERLDPQIGRESRTVLLHVDRSFFRCAYPMRA